jgi:hypothetical protein
MYGGNVRDEEVGEEGEGKHGEEADEARADGSARVAVEKRMMRRPATSSTRLPPLVVGGSRAPHVVGEAPSVSQRLPPT